MYFSKVFCDPARPGALTCWDPYQVHRFVWRLFDLDPDAARDFLYRYDLERGRPRFFLLSRRPPRASGSFWRAETKEFRPHLEDGDRLAFALRVNPVICVRGKRHDVVMHRKKNRSAEESGDATTAMLWHEAGMDWLRPRAEGAGFMLRDNQVRVDGYQRGVFRKQRREAVIATLDFHGLLEVSDAERFTQMLFHGLGRAKGFGCGLMLIRRA